MKNKKAHMKGFLIYPLRMSERFAPKPLCRMGPQHADLRKRGKED